MTSFLPDVELGVPFRNQLDSKYIQLGDLNWYTMLVLRSYVVSGGVSITTQFHGQKLDSA